MQYPNFPLLLAQQEFGGDAGPGPVFWIVYAALILVSLVGMWKVFEKAGKPGWGSIIPIYNVVLLLEIAGRPIWWIILFIIPCVNIITIVIPFDVAKRFGKGVGFGLGLLFLPFIFYPMLGFGDAKFQGGEPN